MDNVVGRPLEVEVRDSVEKALKILKQKMSKEGLLQEVKRRRYHEKAFREEEKEDARSAKASSSRNEASSAISGQLTKYPSS